MNRRIRWQRLTSRAIMVLLLALCEVSALGRDRKVAVQGQALFMGAWGNVGSMPRRGVAKAESVVSVVFVPDTSRGRT